MPPKTVKETGLVKIDTFLKRIRDLCRDNNLNVWNKLSIPDLIYQDLLFIYHIPRLQREKILTLDLEFMMDGIVDKITEEMIENVSFSWYNALLSFKTDMDRSAVFKNLWSQLQVSEVKELFDGREFSMFPIEKDTKKSSYYYKLMNAIFEYMANITLESYESNAGYTYFKKGLNKGTAKTFGQFYTPESVIQSVVNEVKPLSTETVLDPSCGSCSFIQGTAKYIKDHEKLNNTTTFHNLYGIEVERTIYTEGIMNIFINFGILPDMKKNIVEEDAYTELLTKDTQYDVIVANPPFGADASTFYEFYYKTIVETTETKTGKTRNKKIITINPEVKCKIPYTNTTESALLFWQIIVQKLKPGGRAGVVMSATLLNDSNADIMKWFLESCSLEKIIMNPAGTFKDQGTSIETFSFIYTKGTPTTNVKIVMLGAEDITVKELTMEQIRDAGWKIKIKEDTVKEVYTGKFERKKLSTILIKTGSGKTNSTSITNSNIVPFYGCTNIVPSGSHDTYDFDDPNYFLFAKSGGNAKTPISYNLGIGRFHHVKGRSAANIAVYQYKLKSDIESVISYEFAYWMLFSKLPEIQSFTKYTTGNGNIDVESMLNEVEIPIPPIPIQETIVANLDRLFANPQDMKETLAFTDRAMDLMLQDPTGAQLEDLVESIRLRQHYQTSANSVKRQMAAVMRSVSARGFERKKLGDIITIESGKYITKKEAVENGFQIYGGGDACDYYSTTSNRNDRLVIAKDGVSLKCVRWVSGEFHLNHHGWTLKCNETVYEKYLYYYLSAKQAEIYSLASGSAQKGINQKTMEQFEAPIPPLPIQTEILAILNEMEAELKTLEQMAAKAETRARFILDGYLSTPMEEETTAAAPAAPAAPISAVLTHDSPAIPYVPPSSVLTHESPPDYKSMTRLQLLEECKKRKLTGVSTKKKDELIKELEK